MPDLTLRQLSAITGECVMTLRRRAKAGDLPGAYRPGKRWWRVREEDVPTIRGLPKKGEAE